MKKTNRRKKILKKQYEIKGNQLLCIKERELTYPTSAINDCLDRDHGISIGFQAF